jgi:hypothetical protein
VAIGHSTTDPSKAMALKSMKKVMKSMKKAAKTGMTEKEKAKFEKLEKAEQKAQKKLDAFQKEEAIKQKGEELEEKEREAEHGHRCQDAQVDDEGRREAAEEDPHRRARREHDLLEHERSGIHQWICAEFEQEGIREREREGVQELVDEWEREFRVVDLG